MRWLWSVKYGIVKETDHETKYNIQTIDHEDLQ